MAAEIRVPRLGWSMETGVFVRWLKADGDNVKVGDALYELEGEKATQEIEAVDAGWLRIPDHAPAPGTEVAVGSVLGYLTIDGEAVPGAASGSPAAKEVCTPKTAAPAAGPAARRLARELGVELTTLGSSGGRVSSADVRRAAASADGNPPSCTPRARRVARELGVAWESLAGSGRNGRIREQDVLAAASRPNTVALPTGVVGRRKTIAQRMLASTQQTAAVTLTTSADATNLVSLRQQFKSKGGTPPTYTDIVAKLAAAALRQHPYMMAGPGDELGVGFAVDTQQGLLVPVLRNIQAQSLPQLALQSKELVAKARDGKLTSSEMSGGAFTITNLGNFGIDAFTPIINLPETAILGLGAIRRVPVVLNDDRVAPRDQVSLSLTFDHGRVGGASAARFLQTIVAALENPSAWLLS